VRVSQHATMGECRCTSAPRSTPSTSEPMQGTTRLPRVVAQSKLPNFVGRKVGAIIGVPRTGAGILGAPSGASKGSTPNPLSRFRTPNAKRGGSGWAGWPSEPPEPRAAPRCDQGCAPLRQHVVASMPAGGRATTTGRCGSADPIFAVTAEHRGALSSSPNHEIGTLAIDAEGLDPILDPNPIARDRTEQYQPELSGVGSACYSSQNRTRHNAMTLPRPVSRTSEAFPRFESDRCHRTCRVGKAKRAHHRRIRVGTARRARLCPPY
jgi:hypothetical protein